MEQFGVDIVEVGENDVTSDQLTQDAISAIKYLAGWFQ